MLFHMLSLWPDRTCRVSDLNSDLVLAYITIRDRPDDLLSVLRSHAREYSRDPRAYYYSVRSARPRSQIAKAARLIFLNRTCFNGLYRVNSRGMFNVPLGRYTNPNIANVENINAVSKALQSGRVDISCQDFVSILRNVKKGDLVYLDPPYQPVSNTANFTSYTDSDFGYGDLQRLAGLCIDLDKKGARVMLSNSDSEVVSKLFPNAWRRRRIAANRSINSDSGGRTGHHELLITNY